MSLQFVVNKPRGPLGWWIMVPILGATVAALWWSAVGTHLSISGFIDGLPWIGDFIGRMLPPNFAFMEKLLKPAIETVQIALWGTLLGIVLALPVCFFAARNLSPSPSSFLLPPPPFLFPSPSSGRACGAPSFLLFPSLFPPFSSFLPLLSLLSLSPLPSLPCSVNKTRLASLAL